MAEQSDCTFGRPEQADDLAQQGRLAAAGAADHAQDVAGAHVKIDASMHHRTAEAGVDAAHLDDRRGGH